MRAGHENRRVKITGREALAARSSIRTRTSNFTILNNPAILTNAIIPLLEIAGSFAGSGPASFETDFHCVSAC